MQLETNAFYKHLGCKTAVNDNRVTVIIGSLKNKRQVQPVKNTLLGTLCTAQLCLSSYIGIVCEIVRIETSTVYKERDVTMSVH